MMDMTPYYWLTPPVKLHSDRTRHCKMTPEQCAFVTQPWVNWYMGDLVYSRNAVYFFVATIAVFVAAYAFGRLLPASVRRRPAWLRGLAAVRALSYPDALRLRAWQWNAPSVGVCLLGGAGAVYFLALTLGPHPYYWPNTATVTYGDSPPLANRSGYMSLGCLPFILAFGAKANLVTAVTGVAPEKLIIFHLMAAWGMFVMALVHTFPFVVYNQSAGTLMASWSASAQWLTGVVALLAQAGLTFLSLPFVRHAAYETFKALHFSLALVFVVFLFIHCDFTLTSWDYFIAAGSLYLASLFFAMGRTYFAHGLLTAHLELVTEDTLRIAIPTVAANGKKQKRSLHWRPGQHLYLRFLTGGVHALTVHPFTICSVPAGPDGVMRQSTARSSPPGSSPLVSEPASPTGTGDALFFVRPRGGVTGRLAAMARKRPDTAVPVFVEGPYGGVPHRWDEGFDATLVVAGGAGAGFALGLVEDWVARSTKQRQNSSSWGTGTLLVVVSSRDPGFRQWYVEALRQMADRYSGGAMQGVRVVLHATGTALRGDGGQPDVHEAEEVASGDEKAVKSALPADDVAASTGSDEAAAAAADEAAAAATASGLDITYRRGQADLPALVRSLAATPAATHVGVAVCGPSSMAHDVAAACGAEQRRIMGGGPGAAEVWLHQEGFSN